MHARISEGIWVGDTAMCSDATFFSTFDISAIISLDKGVKSQEDIWQFVVPDTELLDNEVPKILTKLESISNTISELRENGRSVFIQCADGKNKSLLVAGYYLIKRGGMDPVRVVDLLIGLYFTPAQRDEEVADKLRLERVQREEQVAPLSEDDMKRQEARHARRALTNRSFQKILRNCRK